MSRKPTTVNENAVDLLRHMVKSKSNLNCTSFSEIQALQEGITKSTNEYLSVQTLSRFFGVVRSHFKPSHHTLNTLSLYVNYSSFKHFELLNESGSVKNDSSFFVTDLFHSLFSSIDPSGEQNLELVSKNILKWMIQNPQYYSDIYPAFSKTPFGRRMFFEGFANIDALNAGYGNGLHYYLLHSEITEEKAFAHSMCCFWYFLTWDVKKFKEYFEYLQHYKQSQIVSFHPMVVDRYYAAFIYNQAINLKSETSHRNAGMVDFDILTSTSISSMSGSIYVAEALLLTGEFQRAWQLLNNSQFTTNGPQSLKSDFDMQVRILKLLSGYLSGNITQRRSLSYYLDIVSKPMPFLSENYYSLLLLFVKYKLFTRFNVRKQVIESSRKLIDKTGFKFFRMYLKSNITN